MVFKKVFFKIISVINFLGIFYKDAHDFEHDFFHLWDIATVDDF